MTSTTSLIETRQLASSFMEPTSSNMVNADSLAMMSCRMAAKRNIAPPRITPLDKDECIISSPQVAHVEEPTTVLGAEDEPEPDNQKVYRALVKAKFHRLHTYQELEHLSRIPEYGYLARDVKLEQMKCLTEELQEVTQVDLCDFDKTVDAALGTAKLDLSGIMHSIDIDCLNARLRDKGDDTYAVCSIHPDDWVAGRAQPPDPETRWCNWSLHGKLGWHTRPTGDPDVAEELVSLARSSAGGSGSGTGGSVVVRRAPGTGVQHRRRVTSRVVDHHVIELADEGSSPLLKHLPSAVTFIGAHLGVPGRRVLVHCKVGHSRSASVVTAFLLHRYYHGVIAARGGESDRAATVAHLRERCDAMLRWLSRRRPGVRAPEENNFTQQLYAYADYLVYGTMPALPAAKVKRDGGDQMRDAAAVVFYKQGQRPPLNIVRHYFERRTPSFYRFPEGMLEFMKRWLVLEKLRWNPNTGRLEDIE